MGKFNPVQTTLNYRAIACWPIMLHILKQESLLRYSIGKFCEKISSAEHFKVVSARKFKIVTM